MSAPPKVEAPKTGDNVDPGKFKKLAQRVEETVQTTRLFPEAKQLDPNLLYVSPNNRLGGSPNVQHVHWGILKSFQKNSFDRTRPLPGICVKVESDEGIKQLLDHNRKFTKGQDHLPPILDAMRPLYATLACTHLNIALRCIKNGTPSPIGNIQDLLTQESLAELVQNGHKWWVLPENVLVERQVDISVWRNMDQNDNQRTHELEILQTIKFTAQTLLEGGKDKVAVGDLVAHAQRRNPAKIMPQTWMSICKYYVSFLENDVVDLVDDLQEFHSANVDPLELSVPTTFFSLLTSEEALKKCPQVRHYLMTTQYTMEKVREQSSGPATAQFLESAQITSLCKKPDQLNQVEKTIRDLKSKYLPILAEGLGERTARLEMTVLMDLILRCLFCKPWPANVVPKVPLAVGKFSDEKVKALTVHWAKILDLKHPALGFAAAAGLQEEVEADAEESQEVKLEGLRTLKRNSSGGPDVDQPKFKRGDEVTVIRKMTWALPQPSNPKFRKDLVEGLTGHIEGYSGPDMRTVLLKVNLNVMGKKKDYTQGVYPRNLKLTSEYLLDKAGGSADSGEPGGDKKKKAEEDEGSSGPDKFKWCIGSSAPADVQVVDKWAKDLVADADDLSKNMWIRGRISVGMQAMYDVLPKYKDSDFLVVHRRNQDLKGQWQCEVWTKKDFEPMEIMIAPFSSQLKDTHLMASAHAVVTLPKNGRGAHPANGTLALDGRMRNAMAPAGTLDQDLHTGSLFWMVTRSSEPKQCNLDLDQVTWEQKVKVSVPAYKKRKTESVEWDSAELPAFPVLVNKKKIMKQTRLCMFLADKKKNNKDKDK